MHFSQENKKNTPTNNPLQKDAQYFYKSKHFQLNNGEDEKTGKKVLIDEEKAKGGT